MTDTPTIKREDNGRAECTVTFTEAQTAPAEEIALQELGKNVKIEGFRPGKVPVEMLKEKVEPGRLLEETVRHLLPATFEQLVKEHNIETIIPPKVEAVTKEPLTLKIVFVERPKITLKGIDKIKVEKTEPKVDDKDVQRMVDYILQQHKKTTTVDRAAKEGDEVLMDFWAEDTEGKEIEMIRSTDYRVVIGSKTLLPGFEDSLVGLSKDGETSFTLTFPEKYHAEELQNKEAKFHVTVKGVDEVETPELTDEFCKTQLNVDSVDAFKKQLHDSMVEQELDIDAKRREQQLLGEISKAVQVELVPELVEDEVRHLIEEFQQQLAEQQLTIEQWMEKTGKKQDELLKELEEKAKERLTLRLGLQELITQKEATLSDEEMESVVADFLAPAPAEERKNIEPMYKKGQRAYEQLRWQKSVEKLIAMMLS